MPQAPHSILRPGTFNTDSDATFAKLLELVEKYNANIPLIEGAALSAQNALTASDAALAAANFKGEWSGLAGALAIPASASHSGKVWMLLSSVADVAAHTPGVSPNWLSLTATPAAAGVASTATSQVLTADSAYMQITTPAAHGVTFTLPDATTVQQLGAPRFAFVNRAVKYPVAILNAAGKRVAWAPSGGTAVLALQSDATAAGVWAEITDSAERAGGVVAEGGYMAAVDVPAVNGDPSPTVVLDNGNMAHLHRSGGVLRLAVYLPGRVNPAANAIVSSTITGYTVALCALSSTRVLALFQGGANYLRARVADIDASTGAITQGVELSIADENNPAVARISSSQVLLATLTPAGVLQVRTLNIDGAGNITANTVVTGSSYSAPLSLVALSASTFHLSDATNVRRITVSGTVPTLGAAVSAAGSVVGLVSVSSTQSMIVLQGTNQLSARLVTDATPVTLGAAVTLSNQSVTAWPYTTVSQAAPGVALVFATCAGNNYLNAGPWAAMHIGVAAGQPVLLKSGWVDLPSPHTGPPSVLSMSSGIGLLAFTYTNGTNSMFALRTLLTVEA
jgi:hypothetical protein